MIVSSLSSTAIAFVVLFNFLKQQGFSLPKRQKNNDSFDPKGVPLDMFTPNPAEPPKINFVSDQYDEIK